MAAFQVERRTSAVLGLNSTAAMPRAYTHLLPPEETAKSYAAQQVMQQHLNAVREHAATIQQQTAQAADPLPHAHVRGLAELLSPEDSQGRLCASDKQKPLSSSHKQHAPVTWRVSAAWIPFAAVTVTIAAGAQCFFGK